MHKKEYIWKDLKVKNKRRKNILINSYKELSVWGKIVLRFDSKSIKKPSFEHKNKERFII